MEYLTQSSNPASQMVSSKKSNQSLLSGNSEMSTMDAARAVELDRAVDTVDWEGVVFAAATFQTGDGSAPQRTKSTEDPNSVVTPQSQSLNVTPFAYSPSSSSADSKSPSVENCLADIRAEVE